MILLVIAGAITFGLAVGMCAGYGIQKVQEKQDAEADEFVENLRNENAIEMLDISTYWPEKVEPGMAVTFEQKMAETESPEEDAPEEEDGDTDGDKDVDTDVAERLMMEHRYNMKHAGEPYIIDESYYFAKDAGYNQETLTYSESEMLLRDENEQVIMDVARYIGYETLDKFGEGSSDPNSVYVRNDRMMMDYEVVREE